MKFRRLQPDIAPALNAGVKQRCGLHKCGKLHTEHQQERPKWMLFCIQNAKFQSDTFLKSADIETMPDGVMFQTGSEMFRKI